LPWTGGHLNIPAVMDIKKKLEDGGNLTKDGKVVATHFSHNIGLQYEDLCEIFASEQILVAYDGMVLHI